MKQNQKEAKPERQDKNITIGYGKVKTICTLARAHTYVTFFLVTFQVLSSRCTSRWFWVQ